MNDKDEMTEESRIAMERYGITSASKMMYFYKEYRYDNFSDALKYAKSEAKSSQSTILHSSADR